MQRQISCPVSPRHFSPTPRRASSVATVIGEFDQSQTTGVTHGREILPSRSFEIAAYKRMGTDDFSSLSQGTDPQHRVCKHTHGAKEAHITLTSSSSSSSPSRRRAGPLGSLCFHTCLVSPARWRRRPRRARAVFPRYWVTRSLAIAILDFSALMCQLPLHLGFPIPRSTASLDMELSLALSQTYTHSHSRSTVPPPSVFHFSNGLNKW